MSKAKAVYFTISATLILFLAISVFSLFEADSFFYSAVSAGDAQMREVYIPLGSSTERIAAILQEEELIRSTFAFRLLSRNRGYDSQLKAGNYMLSGSMSMEEILLELQKGVIKLDGLRFTIPEGYSVEEIGARLEELGLAEKEEFLGICRSYGKSGDDFLRQIFGRLAGDSSQVNYRVEGYLFPDTYEIHEGATAEYIVDLMLDRFIDVFNAELRQRAEELGLELQQIVTIASIVEKEAVLAEERPLVAAVFYNRINSGFMPYLQSCATIQYILGEPKQFLTYRDLEIESPFNTYLHPGLPPGPIASPGLRSLEAALYPADVDYLFFVAKEDGSGGHYFNRTLEEHDYYKSIAQQNRE